MKSFLGKISFFSFVFVGLFGSANASVLQDDIDSILAKSNRSYNRLALPVGYSDQVMDVSRFPFDHPEVANLLVELDQQSLKQWHEYVDGQWELHQQGEYTEFDFTDEASVEEIKDNPYLYLGLDSAEPLNPVENVYILSKNGEVVGYVIELFNTMRAQTIEDGSGIVLYLDLDFKLVVMTEWDS